jgi:hypothetical protein
MAPSRTVTQSLAEGADFREVIVREKVGRAESAPGRVWEVEAEGLGARARGPGRASKTA